MPNRPILPLKPMPDLRILSLKLMPDLRIPPLSPVPNLPLPAQGRTEASNLGVRYIQRNLETDRLDLTVGAGVNNGNTPGAIVGLKVSFGEPAVLLTILTSSPRETPQKGKKREGRHFRKQHKRANA